MHFCNSEAFSSVFFIFWGLIGAYVPSEAVILLILMNQFSFHHRTMISVVFSWNLQDNPDKHLFYVFYHFLYESFITKHTDACVWNNFELFDVRFTFFLVRREFLFDVFVKSTPPFWCIYGPPMSASWKTSESLTPWFAKLSKYSLKCNFISRRSDSIISLNEQSPIAAKTCLTAMSSCCFDDAA